ncbi:hypothetical protein [Mucilaginibacter sp. 3215]|uniref:hypothetical protein n=1 Tax=Mucilaginibacter sp. 3215 TaxID=3373912 RepID=UPI003D23EB7B
MPLLVLSPTTSSSTRFITTLYNTVKKFEHKIVGDNTNNGGAQWKPVGQFPPSSPPCGVDERGIPDCYETGQADIFVDRRTVPFCALLMLLL